MIEAALREVGASRSIVVDEDGVILAGNATVEAAAAAGIERVQIVDADGETIIAVRRTGLTPEQKTRLALFDNRTAELAEWDEAQLAELVQETDLSGLFHDDELDAIIAGVTRTTEDDAVDAGRDVVSEQWMVLVECDDEAEQAALLERFAAEGLRCRALTS